MEVGEIVLVDFGKKWGKLSGKVLDDPEVVEGQYISDKSDGKSEERKFFLVFLKFFKKGSFR